MAAHGLAVAGQGSAAASQKVTADAPVAARKQGNKPSFVADEVLVKFKADVSEAKTEKVHSKHGTKKLREYKKLRLHRVKLREGDNVQDVIEKYKADPEVEYAEPNFMVSTSATPDDPLFSNLWGLSNNYGPGKDINATAAWDITTGSDNVVVAVIDTGIDYNHPDLQPNMWVNNLEASGNGTDEDADGYADDTHGINAITSSGNPMDDHGHGTHVAGTIGAAGNNGVGVAGVNWSVKLLGCKFLDSNGNGNVADAVGCLLYVKALKDRGVNIVATNNSWGGAGYSQALSDAISAQRDILFVAAAGNSRTNNDTTPFYPAAYDLPNLISVAATTSSDALAPFSNVGQQSVDVGAPGMNIFSTMSQVNSFGVTDGYGELSGTSMATPHVTGVAALLKAQDPARDWRSIKNLILSTGDDLPDLTGRILTGKRIDAFAAMTCTNSPLLLVGRLPATITQGSTYTLSAVSVNCDKPAGPVMLNSSDGQSLELKDDGIAPDAAAGDGVFTGNWTAGAKPVVLTFSSPAGTQWASFPPLEVAPYLADARLNLPYSQAVIASGGIPPYSWAITGGALPPGLALDATSGVISGTPTSTSGNVSYPFGGYSFTAEVTDARGQKVSSALMVRVVLEEAEQKWGRILTGNNNAQGFGTATDASGNSYVTGQIHNGANFDAFLAKYDPSGTLVWSKTYDKGIGEEERGYGVACDPSGNVYVAGASELSGRSWGRRLLLKYDASGNLLWDKEWDRDVAFGVTTDAAGYLYTVGATMVADVDSRDKNRVLLNKYDSAGNVIWSKVHESTADADYGFSIAVDPAGNVYFGGGRSKQGPDWYVYYDFLLAKYDASANLIWSSTESPLGGEASPTGTSASSNTLSVNKEPFKGSTLYTPAGGMLIFPMAGWNFIQGVAIDGEGNLLTAGYASDAYYYGITAKYTADGMKLWQTERPGFLPSGIAVAGTSAYVAGSGPGSETMPSGATTVKYDAAGNEAWLRSLYTGTHPGTSIYPNPESIAADPAGVTVTGWIDDVGSRKVITARYTDPDPNAVPKANDLSITALTGDLSNGILSYSITVKNSGAGTPSAPVGLYFTSGATPSTNDPFIALIHPGTIPGGTEQTFFGQVPVPTSIAAGTYAFSAIVDPQQTTIETDETNNAALAEGPFTIGGNIDLVVLQDMSVFPDGNGNLSYSVTVKNIGNSPAAASATALYFSADPYNPSPDHLIAPLPTPPLAAGEETILTGKVLIPSSIPAGYYAVAAYADDGKAIAEINEVNNATLCMWSFPVGSDLTVQAVGGGINPEGKLEYGLVVKNTGNVAAAASSTGLYFTAGTAPYRDHLVGPVTIPALAAGQEEFLTGTVAIPSGIPAGTYYIAAIADDGNAVQELDETNNVALGNQVVTSQLDLIITSVSGTVAAGNLTYSIRVKNIGPGTTGQSTTGLSLSAGNPPAPDRLVGFLSTPPLGPGEEQELTGNVSLPAGIPAGSYYLVAFADLEKSVPELDETNNSAVGDRFDLGSDLVITAVSGSVEPDQYFYMHVNYSVTVRNVGNLPADLSTAGFYLSKGSAPSLSDFRVVSLGTKTLAAGEAQLISGWWPIDTPLAAGTYRFAAIADTEKVIEEKDETNNGALGNEVTLSNDLSIPAVTGTVSGGTLSYSVTLKNGGNALAPGKFSLYFSPSAVPSTSGYLITDLSYGNMAGGGENTYVGTVPVPGTIPPGTYYLTAFADSSNAVAETDESNNGAVAGSYTLESDLAVSAVSASVSSGIISYSVTVKNQGDLPAAASTAGIYLPPAGAAYADYPLTTISTDAIAVGISKTYSGSMPLSAALAPGNYTIAALADAASLVQEKDETNNGRTGNQVSVVRDLTVSAVSGSLSAGNLTYSVTVKNAGNAPAAASTTAVYLSADAAASTSDYGVISLDTPAIPAGGQQVVTGTVAVPSSVPPAIYYLAAIADVDNAVAEGSETNNGAAGNQVTVTRDLVSSAVSGTLTAGNITYSVTVKNTGNTATAASVTGIYLSSDTVAATSDYPVTRVATPAIPAGGQQLITGTVAVPADVPAGTYYVASVADLDNAVPEGSETNNGAVGNQVAVGSAVDLQVGAVSGTISAGTLNYSITVKNSGAAASAASTTALYLKGFLSILPVPGGAAPADAKYTIASLSTGAIPAGGQVVLSGSVTIPSMVPLASYLVAAGADANNALAEIDDANNETSGNMVSYVNDLSITGVSGTVSSGVLSYSMKVTNSGTANPTTGVGIYLSSDAAATTADYAVTQLAAVAVPGGTEKILTGSVAVPSTIPSGTYYLAAVADPANMTPETDESNNGAVGGQIFLGGDLKVTALSGSVAGANLTYSVTVKNSGSTNAAVSSTGLYLSADGSAALSDYRVTSLSTAALLPGAETVLSGTTALPATIPAGSYYLAAISDMNGAVKESDEGNNGAVGNQLSLANDLSISALSGTLSGGVLSYSVTVRNTGVGAATTSVPLYFSTDQTASTSDYLITTLSVSSLAAGMEKVLSGTINVPGTIPSGTYYLAALADPLNTIAETDESNNAAVASQLTVNSDLQVGAVSGSIAGGKLTYSVTLNNAGNIATATSSTELIFASTPSGGSPSYTVTTLTTPAIAAGAQRVLSGTVSVPTTIPAGSYYFVAEADSTDAVKESVETNNLGSGNSIVLANDLSIGALSGTLSGGVLSYSVTVKNAGSGSVNASVPLYFSPDATASASDYQLVSLTVSGLAAGTEKTYTGNVSVPGTIPSGSYYLTAIADAGNAVAETDESNNGFVASQFSVNSDLQVGALSGSIAGGKLSYSVTLNNNGNITAGASSTALILASSPSGGAPSYTVTTVSTSTIGAAGQKVLSGSVAVPTTIPPGTYYLVAQADSGDAVKESVETNNLGSGNSVVLANDLSISALSGSFSAGVLSYSVTVKNAGTGSVNASVPLYFSPDQSASTNDYQLVSLTLSGLAAGSEKIFTGTVTVPGTIPSGTYYLAAIADPSNAVVETDEANNTLTANQFAVNSDLQVGTVSGTLAAGKLTYSVTLNNTGNMGSAAFSVPLTLSTAPSGGASSYLVTTLSCSSIVAGGQRVLTGSVTIPTTIPPGSYYVVATADSTDAVKESAEGNNVGVGNSVVLANDLSIGALSGSVSGGVLSYSVTVRNSGTGIVNTTVPVYFSGDATVSAGDYQVATVTVSNLAAGTEKTFTGTVTVPGTIPSGTYYLAALADPGNAVAETDEANNGYVANQLTVDNDLQITAVSGSVSAGKLTYSVTVRNSGSIAAAASTTGIYLSTDAVATTADYLVTSLSTSTIAPATEKVLSGTVTLPSTIPPGTFYVAAIADRLFAVQEKDEGNNGLVGNSVTK